MPPGHVDGDPPLYLRVVRPVVERRVVGLPAGVIVLELDETLFVGHRSDIGRGSAYGLISAVASFANTIGGWLLLGVDHGRPSGAAAVVEQ